MAHCMGSFGSSCLSRETVFNTNQMFPPSLVILARYGLDGRKDTQMVHSNALNEDTQDELGDPRLEKLWHKVPLAFPPPYLLETCAGLWTVGMWGSGGYLCYHIAASSAVKPGAWEPSQAAGSP